MERTSFLAALLCLGSGSADAAAPGVYQSPPCIFAAVGMEPIMECRFPPMEASEIVFMSWYKEERRLSPSDRRFRRYENLTAGSASLRIPRVQAQDAGVYTCEVGTNTHSSTGNGTKLEVQGSTPPRNQSAMEGCVHVTAPQEEKGIIILLRNVVGAVLLLTLALAVIIVHFMSGPTGDSE
ncbi:phosphorylase b kinase gamma catalytic chain, liver/testis isoform [Platysternon megacephalum]|uniref:Phosphorylase b kinase gamma catalytic chain, liver/testis isoform n=1 Tax=Platysternon megacephalum TaxID=55544 RepID=A0A4D9DYX7_9SAUR|nr:phosphorylase b kinase gamma catalytic chain, liver/testis isoform [Platysternon megacephalum]